MEYVHMKTAYILRWNQPDYKVIIGVFDLMEHLDGFFVTHFPGYSILDDCFKIETGRHYDPRRR